MPSKSHPLLPLFLAALLLSFAPGRSAQALTINFDSILVTTTFLEAGLLDFEGFLWSEGWGSNHVSDPLTSSPVLGVSGDTSAANSGGDRSLTVAFGGPADVPGAFLRQLDIGGAPAQAVELLGRNADGEVVAYRGPRALESGWRFVPAGFEGIHSLEIRTDEAGGFFGVDNLIVDPEPLDLAGAALDLVARLPDERLDGPGAAGLERRLELALLALERGRERLVGWVLRSALLRTDGCVLRGEPDRPKGRRFFRGRRQVPDALGDCTDQEDLFGLISQTLDALPEAHPHRRHR